MCRSTGRALGARLRPEVALNSAVFAPLFMVTSVFSFEKPIALSTRDMRIPDEHPRRGRKPFVRGMDSEFRSKNGSSIAIREYIPLFFLMNSIDAFWIVVLPRTQQTLYRRGLIREGVSVPSSCWLSIPIGTRS